MRTKEKPTHLNVRYVPRETLYNLKLMAAIEGISVKALVLGLIDRKMEELEMNGRIVKRRR